VKKLSPFNNKIAETYKTSLAQTKYHQNSEEQRITFYHHTNIYSLKDFKNLYKNKFFRFDEMER